MAFLIVILVLALALLLLPIFTYLHKGWAFKRHELLSYFTEESAEKYFDQFPAWFDVDAGKYLAAMERIYDKTMGRKQYLLPLAMLTAVAVIELMGVIAASLHKMEYATFARGFVLPDAAMAAIAGAYMWVTSELIYQTQRRSLLPTDLYAATLRLAIAVPLGYAFAALVADDIKPFIAFAIGAFPLGPLTVIMRRLVTKKLGIEETQIEASDQVSLLQGVNKDIAERLGQCDVFTVSQLGSVDPVSISQRTHLGFNFVLDCVSQALAWNYLDSKLDILRPMGLRGAHEIRTFIRDLDEDKNNSGTKFEKMLKEFSVAVDIPETSLENTFREISEDPQTKLIHKIFR